MRSIKPYVLSKILADKSILCMIKIWLRLFWSWVRLSRINHVGIINVNISKSLTKWLVNSIKSTTNMKPLRSIKNSNQVKSNYHLINRMPQTRLKMNQHKIWRNKINHHLLHPKNKLKINSAWDNFKHCPSLHNERSNPVLLNQVLEVREKIAGSKEETLKEAQRMRRHLNCFNSSSALR